MATIVTPVVPQYKRILLCMNNQSMLLLSVSSVQVYRVYQVYHKEQHILCVTT